ncbi:MAG: ATP-binding protein [Chloroflexota bacterium]
MNKQQGPLEEPAGEWFVNRKEALELFWKWATDIPDRPRGSYALIGLRRTGKTTIIHKVFNRLFHEQRRVMPIYVTFAEYLNRSKPLGAYEFAEEYFMGVMRSYLAFRHRRPDLHHFRTKYQELYLLAHELSDELALEWFRIYQGEKTVTAHNVMQWAINFPKGYAWTNDMPMAIFIDEFQVLTDVYNPDSQRMRDLTDSFQQASETRWAPIVVSGSSVSMMVDDALSGLLSGRFSLWYVEPLLEEHAVDLVFRLGQIHNIKVTPELAKAIWELTQGYPYPIERLMKSASPAINRLPDLDALDEILLFELTERRGGLWYHYHSEYGKYINQINGDQITRKTLLWIIKHPGQRIFADAIAAELNLDEKKVRESLEKLHEADIIHSTGWLSYEDPKDPMLHRYIEFQHHREVEQLSPEEAVQNLISEVNRIRGIANHQVGHLAEVIVAGVMRNFDGSELDGQEWFGIPGLITLPKIEKIERREGVIKKGEYNEIDVIGEFRLPDNSPSDTNSSAPKSIGAWLVSVRYRNKKMGLAEIEKFLKHTMAVKSEKGYATVIRWYFSKSGFTEEATKRLQEDGIYFSDQQQFNNLANQFDFLGLPA